MEDVVLTDMGDTMEVLRKNAREHAPATRSLTAVDLEWYSQQPLCYTCLSERLTLRRGKPSAIDGKKFDLIVGMLLD